MKPVLIACIAAVAATPLLAATPELVPDGDPVDCISTNLIRSTRVVDNQTVDFQMNGNKIYRNALPDACPGLKMEQSFTYSPTNSRLCNVDIITVLNQGGGPRRGASCGLGQFVPMKAVKADKTAGKTAAEPAPAPAAAAQ